MKNKKKKRDRLITAVMLLTLIVGVCIMLYPSFSNYWNSRVQSKAIADYARAVAKMDNSEKERMLADARSYNKRLAEVPAPFENYAEVPGYNGILNVSGTGIMGYIEIPKINVMLPIYHSTSPEVLNIAVGHMQGSSFPVGGKGCHAVISSHRGLPTSKLFTDLDKLVEDDVFTITVLDNVLTYEVDKISVILPYEYNEFAVSPDNDYVTLMTCTPYGINTHRLLIRGRRIETASAPEAVRVPADAVEADKTSFIGAVSAPVLLLLVLFWIFGGKQTNTRTIDKYTIENLTDKNERHGE